MKEGGGFHHGFPFLACDFTCVPQQQMMPLHFSKFHTRRLCLPAHFPVLGRADLGEAELWEGFRAWHQVLPDNTHCSSRAVCTHSLTHAPQALTALQPSGFWLSSPCWDCSQTQHHTHYHTWFPNLHVFWSSQLLTGLIMSWKNVSFHSQALQKEQDDAVASSQTQAPYWLTMRFYPHSTFYQVVFLSSSRIWSG